MVEILKPSPLQWHQMHDHWYQWVLIGLILITVSIGLLYILYSIAIRIRAFLRSRDTSHKVTKEAVDILKRLSLDAPLFTKSRAPPKPSSFGVFLGSLNVPPTPEQAKLLSKWDLIILDPLQRGVVEAISTREERHVIGRFDVNMIVPERDPPALAVEKATTRLFRTFKETAFTGILIVGWEERLPSGLFKSWIDFLNSIGLNVYLEASSPGFLKDPKLLQSDAVAGLVLRNACILPDGRRRDYFGLAELQETLKAFVSESCMRTDFAVMAWETVDNKSFISNAILKRTMQYCNFYSILPYIGSDSALVDATVDRPEIEPLGAFEWLKEDRMMKIHEVWKSNTHVLSSPGNVNVWQTIGDIFPSIAPAFLTDDVLNKTTDSKPSPFVIDDPPEWTFQFRRPENPLSVSREGQDYTSLGCFPLGLDATPLAFAEVLRGQQRLKELSLLHPMPPAKLQDVGLILRQFHQSFQKSASDWSEGPSISSAIRELAALATNSLLKVNLGLDSGFHKAHGIRFWAVYESHPDGLEIFVSKKTPGLIHTILHTFLSSRGYTRDECFTAENAFSEWSGDAVEEAGLSPRMAEDIKGLTPEESLLFLQHLTFSDAEDMVLAKIRAFCRFQLIQQPSMAQMKESNTVGYLEGKVSASELIRSRLAWYDEQKCPHPEHFKTVELFVEVDEKLESFLRGRDEKLLKRLTDVLEVVIVKDKVDVRADVFALALFCAIRKNSLDEVFTEVVDRNPLFNDQSDQAAAFAESFALGSRCEAYFDVLPSTFGKLLSDRYRAYYDHHQPPDWTNGAPALATSYAGAQIDVNPDDKVKPLPGYQRFGFLSVFAIPALVDIILLTTTGRGLYLSAFMTFDEQQAATTALMISLLLSGAIGTWISCGGNYYLISMAFSALQSFVLTRLFGGMAFTVAGGILGFVVYASAKGPYNGLIFLLYLFAMTAYLTLFATIACFQFPGSTFLSGRKIILGCIPFLFVSPVVTMWSGHDSAIYISVMYIFIGFLVFGLRSISSKWILWYQDLRKTDDAEIKNWFTSIKAGGSEKAFAGLSDPAILKKAREALLADVKSLGGYFAKAKDDQLAFELARDFEATNFLLDWYCRYSDTPKPIPYSSSWNIQVRVALDTLCNAQKGIRLHSAFIHWRQAGDEIGCGILYFLVALLDKWLQMLCGNRLIGLASALSDEFRMSVGFALAYYLIGAVLIDTKAQHLHTLASKLIPSGLKDAAEIRSHQKREVRDKRILYWTTLAKFLLWHVWSLAFTASLLWVFQSSLEATIMFVAYVAAYTGLLWYQYTKIFSGPHALKPLLAAVGFALPFGLIVKNVWPDFLYANVLPLGVGTWLVAILSLFTAKLGMPKKVPSPVELGRSFHAFTKPWADDEWSQQELQTFYDSIGSYRPEYRYRIRPGEHPGQEILAILKTAMSNFEETHSPHLEEKVDPAFTVKTQGSMNPMESPYASEFEGQGLFDGLDSINPNLQPIPNSDRYPNPPPSVLSDQGDAQEFPHATTLIGRCILALHSGEVTVQLVPYLGPDVQAISCDTGDQINIAIAVGREACRKANVSARCHLVVEIVLHAVAEGFFNVSHDHAFFAEALACLPNSLDLLCDPSQRATPEYAERLRRREAKCTPDRSLLGSPMEITPRGSSENLALRQETSEYDSDEDESSPPAVTHRFCMSFSQSDDIDTSRNWITHQLLRQLCLGFDPDKDWETLSQETRLLLLNRCLGSYCKISKSHWRWLSSTIRRKSLDIALNHREGDAENVACSSDPEMCHLHGGSCLYHRNLVGRSRWDLDEYIARCNYGVAVLLESMQISPNHLSIRRKASFANLSRDVPHHSKSVLALLKSPISGLYHQIGTYIKFTVIALVADPEFQREFDYTMKDKPLVIRVPITLALNYVWTYSLYMQNFGLSCFVFHRRDKIKRLWEEAQGMTITLKRNRMVLQSLNGTITGFRHQSGDGFKLYQYGGIHKTEPEGTSLLRVISTYSKDTLLQVKEEYEAGKLVNEYHYSYEIPKRFSTQQLLTSSLGQASLGPKLPLERRCVRGKNEGQSVSYNREGLIDSGSYMKDGNLIRFKYNYRKNSHFGDELLRAEFVLAHISVTVAWCAPPKRHPEKIERWIPHSKVTEATFVEGADVFETRWIYDHKFHPDVITTLNGQRIQTPPMIEHDHLAVLKKPRDTGFVSDNPLLFCSSLNANALARWLGLSRKHFPLSTSQSRSKLWKAWKDRKDFDGVLMRWLDERLLRGNDVLKRYWRLRNQGRLESAKGYLEVRSDAIMASADLDGDISSWTPLAIKMADLATFGPGGDAVMTSARTKEDVGLDTSKTLHVLAADNGTWPNEGGGVSACRRDMINNLSTIKWHMIAESATDFGLPKHQTEQNVKSLKVIPLWGLDFLTPTHGIFRNRLDSEVDRRATTTTDLDIKRNFIPALTALVKGARSTHLTNADIKQATRALINLNTYFQDSRHWSQVWTSDLTKESWRALWLTQEMPNAKPSRKWFDTELPTLGHLDTALELWFRYLFIFAIPVPDKIPAVFQASHHSVSAAFGIVCKLKRGCTLAVWDHAISWRECNLCLSSALCKLPPFVRNSLLGLMKLTSLLILHHADVILPCADFFNPGWEVEIGTCRGTIEHRNSFRRKVDPVVNGITDMENFTPVKEIKSELPTVTMLSHVWYAKDIKTALLAADIIINEWGFKDYRLDIYGAIDKAPTYSTECQEIIASKGLRSQAALRGTASPTTVLEKTWLFLNSSLSEGLPLALGEAALTGAPVVCTDVGASLRVLSDPDDFSRYSAVVAPNDARALARAQIKMLAMIGEWAQYADDNGPAPELSSKPTPAEVEIITKRMYEKSEQRRKLGMWTRDIVQKSFSGDRYLREHEQMLWIGKFAKVMRDGRCFIEEGDERRHDNDDEDSDDDDELHRGEDGEEVITLPPSVFHHDRRSLASWYTSSPSPAPSSPRSHSRNRLQRPVSLRSGYSAVSKSEPDAALPVFAPRMSRASGAGGRMSMLSRNRFSSAADAAESFHIGPYGGYKWQSDEGRRFRDSDIWLPTDLQRIADEENGPRSSGEKTRTRSRSRNRSRNRNSIFGRESPSRSLRSERSTSKSRPSSTLGIDDGYGYGGRRRSAERSKSRTSIFGGGGGGASGRGDSRSESRNSAMLVENGYGNVADGRSTSRMSMAGRRSESRNSVVAFLEPESPRRGGASSSAAAADGRERRRSRLGIGHLGARRSRAERSTSRGRLEEL